MKVLVYMYRLVLSELGSCPPGETRSILGWQVSATPVLIEDLRCLEPYIGSKHHAESDYARVNQSINESISYSCILKNLCPAISCTNRKPNIVFCNLSYSHMLYHVACEWHSLENLWGKLFSFNCTIERITEWNSIHLWRYIILTSPIAT